MQHINLFLILLFTASFFNGLFLVLNKTYSSYKNWFLGVTIMIYSVFLLSYVWWYEEKFILQAPFLMRMANPPMFLSMPFFYFFVRNTLSGQNHLTKKDLIHFLPAVIHLLELMPFFLMPYSEKYQLALQVVQNPTQLEVVAHGFIPGRWVNVARMVLQLVYYLFSIQLLFKKEVKEIWGAEAISIRNWLLVAVVLVGFLLFSHSFYFIKELFLAEGVTIPPVIEILSYIFFIIPFVLLNIYLRINQHLVYGYTLQQIIRDKRLQSGESKQDASLPKPAAQNTFTHIDLEALSSKLEDLMQVKKLYLNKDLTLKDISDEAGVNYRVLSQFIRIKYNMGVREYINQFRVLAAIDLMKAGYLENKSLEGLCLSVGFNSRITFFLAFKKHTGMSPTEYLKQSGA